MLVEFGLNIYQPKMLLRLSAAGYHFNRRIFYMLASCSVPHTKDTHYAAEINKEAQIRNIPNSYPVLPQKSDRRLNLFP